MHKFHFHVKTFHQTPRYLPAIRSHRRWEDVLSLRYALNFAKKWNAEHIFYIIPFKTIIEQNAKDVREVLRCDDMILEHHSDIVIDNDDEERKLLTERWNAPIVFTTMVQFLNTLFAGKTQSVRRLHNLSNSVIIFDEIQSLPVKCVSMFNNAVQFLSTFCNSTIVLCTATQPQLSSSDLHVPLKLSNPENMIADYKEKFSEFKRTRIVDAMRKAGYTSEELAEFILEKLKDCSSGAYGAQHEKGCEQTVRYFEKRERESERH